MNNVTLDSTGFTEQLGLYDFFNVILSGAVFVVGLCTINQDLSNFLWEDMSVVKGVGVVLLIYILGMILQEIGSCADRYLFNIYKGTNQRILKGDIGKTYKYEAQGALIKNPFTLESYRRVADKLLTARDSEKSSEGEDDQKINDRYENSLMNGYVFSVAQYHVAVCGKDQKVEKLRALFAMSKTLIGCFLILAIVALLSILSNSTPNSAVMSFLSVSGLPCTACGVKVTLALVFASVGVIFIFRARRVMKNFLLILMGTYYALVCAEEEKQDTAKVNKHKRIRCKRKKYETKV